MQKRADVIRALYAAVKYGGYFSGHTPVKQALQ